MNIQPATPAASHSGAQSAAPSGPVASSAGNTSSAQIAAGEGAQNTSGSPASASLSPAAVAKALEQMNQVASSSGLKVEIDSTAPVSQLWINVVDQSTGEVIQKFPPEVFRQMVESGDYRGLVVDEKS